MLGVIGSAHLTCHTLDERSLWDEVMFLCMP